MHLNSKNGSYVINSLSPPRILRHVEGTSDEILLLVLDLHHLTLDGLFGDVLVDEHIFVLAKSVHPIEALPLTGGVPGRVEEKQVVRGSQVQTNPACLQAQQHHLNQGGHWSGLENP